MNWSFVKVTVHYLNARRNRKEPPKYMFKAERSHSISMTHYSSMVNIVSLIDTKRRDLDRAPLETSTQALVENIQS